MRARLRSTDHVDHVVISIAGEKGRNRLDIVGVPEADEFLVEFHQLLSIWRDHGDMSEPKRRHGGSLESRRRRFHRAIKLEDIAARLRIRLDCRGKTESTRFSGKLSNRNIGL